LLKFYSFYEINLITFLACAHHRHGGV